MSKQFERSMIECLREGWSNIERVDPCSESYKNLVKLLDTMDKGLLRQLASANIKFVSKLAQNRVNR